MYPNLKSTPSTKVGGISGTVCLVGVGSIEMMTRTGVQTRLTNALFIHNLLPSLISVVYLRGLGVTTTFDVEKVTIQKGNHLIGTASQMSNGVCKLDPSIMNNKADDNVVANAALKSSRV